MAFRDLRDWLDRLRAEGELHEVTAEVDPHLEVTEIADRLVKSGGGPALLFTNVKGSSHPLLINQFATERRMCMAFDVEEWKAEILSQGELFLKLYDYLPKEIVFQRELLAARLS